MRRPLITLILATLVTAAFVGSIRAEEEPIPHQTEAEFQKLMPITGPVKTMAGTFHLDHSFPAPGEAEKIYDLMDHQRATQLYL